MHKISQKNNVDIFQNDAESSADDDDEVFNAADDEWDKDGITLSPTQ